MALTEHWDRPSPEIMCHPLLRLNEVFVILFGADAPAESEGIYSLRSQNANGLPSETIVAFESHVDAQRYCGHVEAAMQSRHCPGVCGLPPHDLAAFCREHAYHCRLELRGSLLMPPKQSVAMTDWERSLRLRQGTGFQVLEEEPPLPGCTSEQQRPGGQQQQQPSSAAPQARGPDPERPPVGAGDGSAGDGSRPLLWVSPLQLPSNGGTEGQVLPGPGEASKDQASSIVAMLELLLPPDTPGKMW